MILSVCSTVYTVYVYLYYVCLYLDSKHVTCLLKRKHCVIIIVHYRDVLIDLLCLFVWSLHVFQLSVKVYIRSSSFLP